MTFFPNRKPLSSFQMIILGFLTVIFIGCFLLMLPIAAKEPEGTGFLDALFTATSAVCVTGLVVYDTASHWTVFGQAVILLLIQIGGMGVITIAGSLAMIAGRKIGLFQRNTMQEAIAAHNVGGVVRMTGFIIRTSLTLEAVGTILLAPAFCREFGVVRGIWYALFHSISAFCNAGFDLMGCREPYSSLTGFADSVSVNLMISGLIIVGGLGFLTWDDVRLNKHRFRRYRLQSKLIFLVTGTLIAVPMMYLYLFELRLPAWEALTEKERLLAALFQSVTPRTAGFNTINLQQLSGTGQLLTIILMLTGGSPGSTAGGMKTTTIAVLIISAVSVFCRNKDVQCLKRRIADAAVKSAAAIMSMYLVLFLMGGMMISSLEQLPILPCLFETASAIGTVGLSMGITTELGAVSRIILMILMYLGRVGGLTLIYATVSNRHSPARFPQEKITVG